MFVKEVVIDGFKSYAHRTVISGFDENFNAITGQNGTGKSNVLDAICFVLGITKLTQVRVDKMTELIYKNGQAGITKASVTIVFDNSDPETSPVGYESVQEISITRKIVMGGANKYTVNGRLMKQKQVQDLFGSVQLDVNNPHFLIMQGRIVQMMNMKPMETLSMVEEASGTRMYESKKELSLQVIEKKDRKLQEINTMLTEDINPTIEKLQKDRVQYRQFNNNAASIERLERQQIAFSYHTNKQVVDAQAAAEAATKEKLEAAQEAHSTAAAEVKAKESELEELSSKKEGALTGEFKALQAAEDEASKALVKVNSTWQNEQKNLKAEETRLAKAQKALEANAKATEEKQTALRDAADRIANADAERAQLKQTVEDLQTELQCISAGMATQGPGQKDSLGEELVACTTAAAKANSTAKQSAMRLKGVSAELKTVSAKLKKAKNTSGATEKKLADARAEFAKVSAACDALNYSPEREEELQEAVAAKEELCQRLSDKQRKIHSQLRRIDVQYDNPSRNFNRASVKGLVANLTTIKEPAAVQALEVTAGSKLRQLVVDNKDTASALLKHGNLKKRITIIPLDSVNPRCVTQEQVAAAKKLVGQDNVDAAIDLVDFKPEFRPAMEHVFGSTFICKDGNSAKQVTFDKAIRQRSVSYEGDVFNPSGTMSGGSRNAKQSILAAISNLQRITAKLEAETAALATLKAELDTLQAASKQFSSLNKKRELLQHSLEMLEAQAAKSQFGALQIKAAELEESATALAAAEVDARKTAKEMEARVNELQAQLDDFESAQKSMMAQKEADIKAAKQAVVGFESTHRKLQKKLKTTEVECGALAEEKVELENQCAEHLAECEKIKARVAKLSDAVEDARASFDAAKAEVDEKRAALRECDDALKSIVKEKQRLSRQMTSSAGEVKKLEHKLKHLGEEGATAAKIVASLKAAHAWIADEEGFFGKADTDYDFESKNFNQKRLAADLTKLKAQQDAIGRNINHKVMGMIEKAEQDYVELKKKREIILEDRASIMKTIQELDTRKKKALEVAYTKVNRDFGDIFSTLLPGATAKLAPVDGKSIHAGLVPMVGFSGKWKESLMELSGGQRSLLALSLVLAMLLFKPAPMYILDEVDAALDLSHTQNIGRLLKTHFSQSQFIVVSLKEGMFDNANVVFTTQNVDGVSSINRTETLNKSSNTRKGRQGSSSSSSGGSAAAGRGKQSQKRSRLANVSNQ